jgi:chromosome segregation ATPase
MRKKSHRSKGVRIMAVTRKMLKAMGIEDEKIDQIIEAHTDVVNAIKEERDALKDTQKNVDEIQKELDKANKKLESYEKNGETISKSEYDAIKAEYENYKADITAKETRKAKADAYRELLKKAGVHESSLSAILDVTNYDEIEVDEKGEIKGGDKHIEAIKSKWSGFIPTTQKIGINVPNPPANNGNATMTKEQIMQIKDGSVRRQKIAENPALFGIEKG